MKKKQLKPKQKALLKAINELAYKNHYNFPVITTCEEINDLIIRHLQYALTYIPKALRKLEEEGLITEVTSGHIPNKVGMRLFITLRPIEDALRGFREASNEAYKTAMGE
jgi:DNA-binding MarR family transcriptional regulator